MVRYPAAETAERHAKILSEASRLFREHGLSGVSVSDLMQAAELTHGSFYNHFDSKPSLIAACLDHVRERAVTQITAAKPTDAGRRTFVDKYLSLSVRDDPGRACLMSSLGSEIGREAAARPAMTRYVRAFIGKLASHFPWPVSANAERDAIRMTASLVGALVLARAVDDDALSKKILKDVATQFTADGGSPPAKRAASA
jgi:TetR/AcrR family transcriptional repressor of nem operon